MGQTTIIKDGQPVTLPFEEATASQLKEQLSIPTERHIVVTEEDGKSRAVGEHETVRLREGLNISDVPRWRAGAHQTQPKAAVGFRLTSETAYMSGCYEQNVTFGFDQELERWWVQLPQFFLPDGWNHESTPILIVVNNSYPASQPDGFYLSKQLHDRQGRTPAHYFEHRNRFNSLTERGWAWFCVHPDGWKPAVDVRDGDSIFKYMTLIHLVLSRTSAGGA